MLVRRLAIACLAAAAVAGCAGSGGSKESSDAAPLRREDKQVMTVRARVAAVDQTTRLLTLEDESGGRATFYADTAVKNLPQVKVGDQFVGELVESVVLELRAPTPEEAAGGVSILDVSATAEPGEKPAGVFVRQVQAVLTIQAIDKAAGTATLVGPLGNSHTLPARDKRNLDRVKVGDTVVATYTESLRLEVVAPAAP